MVDPRCLPYYPFPLSFRSLSLHITMTSAHTYYTRLTERERQSLWEASLLLYMHLFLSVCSPVYRVKSPQGPLV